MDQATPRYSVIGLGKLGLPSIACLATKDLLGIGVDADPKVVDSIDQGRAPILEARLENTIQPGIGHLRATASITEAVAASDAIVDAGALRNNSLI
jgi:UDP-N-acetyl-D-mannosaminuronate dehydrogenase